MLSFRAALRLSLPLLSVLACGGRTPLLLADPNAGAADADANDSACSDTPVQCVTRSATDPCAAPRLVAPSCDTQAFEWTCPAGAWPYRRVAPSRSQCLPLHDSAGSIFGVAGSLSRVPTEDGRCLWIAEAVQTDAMGRSLRNVAFEPDPRAGFGACPTAVIFLGGAPTPSVVFSDGSVDPTLLVQITGGYLSAGKTRVTYRLFRTDPTSVFGLNELGTGLGYWDAHSQRIVVFGAERPRFETDLDFGNASLLEGDYAYLWGCNAQGHELTEGCLLGRLDTRDRLELYTGNDHWSASALPSAGAIVFEDGPWISSVQRSRANTQDLLHVFAAGFDAGLHIQHAVEPRGPWGEARALAACSLPEGDPEAYCAGPILHAELADPTRPGELVVSYGVGTTGPVGEGRSEDYWSRLVWLDE